MIERTLQEAQAILSRKENIQSFIDWLKMYLPNNYNFSIKPAHAGPSESHQSPYIPMLPGLKDLMIEQLQYEIDRLNALFESL